MGFTQMSVASDGLVVNAAGLQEVYKSHISGCFRKLHRVPYFRVRRIRILLFRVLYQGPLFSETPICRTLGSRVQLLGDGTRFHVEGSWVYVQLWTLTEPYLGIILCRASLTY